MYFQVHKFKVIFSDKDADGQCEQDINSRIAMRKNAFMTKKNLLTNIRDLELRKRIMKATMWVSHCMEQRHGP